MILQFPMSMTGIDKVFIHPCINDQRTIYLGRGSDTATAVEFWFYAKLVPPHKNSFLGNSVWDMVQTNALFFDNFLFFTCTNKGIFIYRYTFCLATALG